MHLASYEYKSKAKYYSEKLGARANTPVINGMSATYVWGLAWVMAYYLQGCPSWTWCVLARHGHGSTEWHCRYYNELYGPMPSDIARITPRVRIDFAARNAEPLKPFEQLMSVFPPQS